MGIRRKNLGIIGLKTGDIDFNRKINTFRVKRCHGFISNIPVSDSLLLEMPNFMRKYDVTGRYFNLTRQIAWEIIKNYGKKLGMDLHPICSGMGWLFICFSMRYQTK